MGGRRGYAWFTVGYNRGRFLEIINSLRDRFIHSWLAVAEGQRSFSDRFESRGGSLSWSVQEEVPVLLMLRHS